MGLLLVGKPFLQEGSVSDGHSQHHQTSLLLKSFAFPSLNSNGVHVRGLDRRTIPDIGLAQVDLGARLTVEGVLDLSKDLCNATRIAQDADVVEISEEHLALAPMANASAISVGRSALLRCSAASVREVASSSSSNTLKRSLVSPANRAAEPLGALLRLLAHFSWSNSNWW